MLRKALAQTSFVLALMLLYYPCVSSGTGKCLVPPAGMVGWWPGDGNGDDLIGGNHGTLENGATFQLGKVQEAFSLNGTNQWVQVPDAPSLNFGTGDFTVDLWVLFNDINGEQVLVEKWVQGGDSKGWTFTKLDGNSLRLALDNEIDVDTPAGSVMPNSWYHLTARRHGTEASVLINGVVAAVGELSPDLNTDSTTALKFGRRFDDRGFYLNGRIDEVELFNRALLDSEIQAIYNAGSAGKCKMGAFASLKPNASISFGPKSADDLFQAAATFRLGATSNGIDPRREDMRLTIGTFSTTIPSGSFKTYRQNKYPDKVRFDGVIDNVKLVVDIYSYGSNRYLLWAKGYGAKLDGTPVPVKMSLRIGDDYGDAKLTVGSAQFKNVVVRPDGATCASIKASNPMAKDSVYTIDPDGSGGNEPVEVYCDMATAGGGWEVLFRGDDPGKWATTFGTPGSGQWGIDKTGLPSSISELRFSRVDTGEALSIPMAAADVYACAPAGSNYFWNGTSYQNFSARHLGVSDTVPLTGPPEFEGYVIAGEPCNNDHHSWGFGHRGWIDDRQAWGWDSQDLGPTVFQIQVR